MESPGRTPRCLPCRSHPGSAARAAPGTPALLAGAAMLQSLWRFLSSFLPRAACQGPADGKDDEARNATPLPGPGEKGPKVLGKPQDRGTDPTERRPTILLVVGPAEHFPKVTGCAEAGVHGVRERGAAGECSRCCVCVLGGGQQ